MSTDPNNPEVLLSVRNEAEAAAIVGALTDQGIETITTGSYTASFIAEAPGGVNILVKHADVERAEQALAEIHQTTVDWRTVDTTEASESPADEDAIIDDQCHVSNSAYLFWGIVLSLNAAGLLFLGVIQRETSVLIPVVLGFVIAVFLFFRRRRSC